MRIDVKKYLFIGLKEEKTVFFRGAQELGVIQFQETHKEVCNAEIQKFADALRVLRAQPPVEQKEGKISPQQVLQLAHEKDQVEDKLRNIQEEIERISPFGNFSLDGLEKVFIQFFTGKNPHPELISVASDHYLSLALEQASYSGMTEIKIERSLSELKEILETLLIQKKDLEHALKQMAAYHDVLHQGLVEALNGAHLKRAENSASDPLDNLFSVTGWVPVDKISHLEELNVFVTEVAVLPGDVVPTHLENQKLSKIGEDLVDIYDTPSTQDKDPSLWVLLGFMVFFAIIIGDGGYGSVYLGLALFIRYKFPDLQGIKKRMLNLATYLSVGCVIWGILSASFFGMEIHSGLSIVHYLALKKGAYLQQPASTDEILLELALFIGVVHLITGMLRYVKKNPGNIGWIIFLIGSYIYFPVFLDAPSLLNYVFSVPFAGEVGLQMIFGGIAWAIGFSVFRNGLIGLTEVMTLIQVFGDVLSYLRLYALGLSGSILSSTINGMSAHMPIAIAAVLIVLGHLINMLLGIMGGVIHGLRLNFLEWYHYSFEGGGRKFKPLKMNTLE